MSNTTMVHIRMDERLKEAATETLGLMGLNLPEAIRVFLTRVVADQQFPFTLQAPQPALPRHGKADIDHETLAATQAFVDLVKGRPDFSGAWLFGSRARQTHRPDSDADIAVVLKGKPGDFLKTKLAMADLAYDVLLATGIRVQPLPVWHNEFAHPEMFANPQLIDTIKREGIAL